MFANLVDYFFSIESKRKKLLAKAPEGPLKEFLKVPFANTEQAIGEVEILALDFETTGLNAKQDRLLSVGYVNFKNGLIKLGQSQHQIICSSGEMDKDNVVIHQITDTEKANGCQLEQVVAQLLSDLAGKAMLVHYANIEKNFLEQACIKLYGMAPVFPIIDTLALAKKHFERAQKHFDPSELRLINLRSAYGLPAHHEHNALNDAIATAELFLAQMRNYPQGFNTPLSEFLLN